MPSQFPEHALVILLRQCFTTPRCQALRCWRQTLPQSSTRPHHTSPAHRRLTPKLMAIGRQQRYYGAHDGQSDNEIRSLGRTNSSRFSSMELQEFGSSVQLEQHGNGGGQQPQESNRIAILGGGITGLASAHYLAKELPNAKIAVYEGSDRLGGWLHSKQVDVGNGTVLFEQGPRTLRPNTPAATTTLEIVCSIMYLANSGILMLSEDQGPRPRRRASDHLEALHRCSKSICILPRSPRTHARARARSLFHTMVPFHRTRLQRSPHGCGL